MKFNSPEEIAKNQEMMVLLYGLNTSMDGLMSDVGKLIANAGTMVDVVVPKNVLVAFEALVTTQTMAMRAVIEENGVMRDNLIKLTKQLEEKS